MSNGVTQVQHTRYVHDATVQLLEAMVPVVAFVQQCEAAAGGMAVTTSADTLRATMRRLAFTVGVDERDIIPVPLSQEEAIRLLEGYNGGDTVINHIHEDAMRRRTAVSDFLAQQAHDQGHARDKRGVDDVEAGTPSTKAAREGERDVAMSG